MKIVPVGHRVLIRPDKIEKYSKGGITLVINEKEEQNAQVLGTVLDVGPDSWKEFEVPWAKIGDRVLYQRYSGMPIPTKEGKFLEDMLLLNDLDITARVEEENV